MTEYRKHGVIKECGIIVRVYCHDDNHIYAINTRPLQMQGIPLRKRHTLPSVAAIYFALSSRTGLLYIGKAKDLNARWKSHHRIPQLEKYGDVHIAWIAFPGLPDEHLNALEAAYIKRFIPPLNQTPVRVKAQKVKAWKA